ncbi:unnamed protein product, partial [Ectocarpus sp. 12 AP-2014]
IRTKNFGENHPNTVGTRNSLEAVRRKVCGKLGVHVRKPHVPRTTQRPDTAQNSFVPVAGVKTRPKQLPATAVGRRKRVNKTEAA